MLRALHPIKPLFGTNQEALVSQFIQISSSLLFWLFVFVFASCRFFCMCCMQVVTLMEQSEGGSRCEEDDGMCHGRLILLPHRLFNLSCFFVGFCFCIVCCMQVVYVNGAERCMLHCCEADDGMCDGGLVLLPCRLTKPSSLRFCWLLFLYYVPFAGYYMHLHVNGELRNSLFDFDSSSFVFVSLVLLCLYLPSSSLSLSHSSLFFFFFFAFGFAFTFACCCYMFCVQEAVDYYHIQAHIHIHIASCKSKSEEWRGRGFSAVCMLHTACRLGNKEHGACRIWLPIPIL